MTPEMIPEYIAAMSAIIFTLFVALDGIAYLYTVFIDIVFTGVQDHTNPTKGDE